MTAINDTNIARSGLVDKLRPAWQAYVERRAKTRLYHRTLNELSALSASELADIGLSRSMITSVAKDAAFGPGH